MTSIELDSKDNFNEFFQYGQDSKVYVDVGGYNGDTVTKALQYNPNLKILIIEPINHLCESMKQKFANNSNITIINKAAYNKKDNIQFNEYQGWANGLSTLQSVMTQLRPEPQFTNQILKYNIETDTLDNILLENNIQSVDYIKIDTEGSEEQVLAGFTKYDSNTRFHIESHLTNLENILLKLLEMGCSNIEKITLARDSNTKEHVVGTIIGTFAHSTINPIIVEHAGASRIKFLIDNLLKNKDKRIINIGCHDNFYFRDFTNIDILNVDKEDHIPTEYKSKNKFQIADAHNLQQFKDKEFDVSILGELLEHVKYPIQVLREAKRVGKNVYITVPNEYEWDKSLNPFNNPEHVRHYTYQTLIHDLDEGLGKGTYQINQYNGGGWSFWTISYETENIIENKKYEVTTHEPIIKTNILNPKQKQELIITTGPIPEDNKINDKITDVHYVDISEPEHNKKLKIALISSPFFTVPTARYGGLEQIVYDLAEGLDELGHDITIFAPKGSKSTKHGKLIEICESNNTVNVNWYELEKNCYNVYSKIITPDRFDIIHGNGWFGFEYMLKSKYPNLKILHTHHGHLNWSTLPHFGKPNLVAISDFMKQETITYLSNKGCTHLSCQRVYNGVDLDRYTFYPFEKSRKSNRPNRLLYVGRFSRIKGAHIAIQVAKRTNQPIDLIGAATFIDDINYLKEIESMCDGNNTVIYKDSTHEFKIKKMQEAKCLIAPSNFGEPFNLTIIEANACGTPVIVTPDGGQPELVIQGKTGYICDNIEQMIDAVNNIDKINPINPNDCREQAERFSRLNMAKNYGSLYYKIMNNEEW